MHNYNQLFSQMHIALHCLIEIKENNKSTKTITTVSTPLLHAFHIASVVRIWNRSSQPMPAVHLTQLILKATTMLLVDLSSLSCDRLLLLFFCPLQVIEEVALLFNGTKKK